MYVKFWGTRGSIPTPLSAQAIKQKYRRLLESAAGLDLTDKAVIDQYLERLPPNIRQPIGGNTPCLEIRSGNQLLIIDAGSGIRLLGIDLMKRGFAQGNHQADILMTHTHWDHIQGFPFFQPAFVPNNQLTFHSPFVDMAERLVQQQHETFFPVPVSYMRAKLQFNRITENTWHQLGNFRVYPMRLRHPGVTYGYRIETGQSCLVMATDSEYKSLKPEHTEAYVQFFKGAGLLIFDAQYSLTEALDKLDWGHSTAMMGAELAYRAQVKRLALFHHDPNYTDDEIWGLQQQAEGYLSHRLTPGHTCKVYVAYDGLSLEI